MPFTATLVVAGRVWTGVPCDSAWEAMESSAAMFAASFAMSPDQALDELAWLEQDGKLVEHLFLDGVEVDIADNL